MKILESSQTLLHVLKRETVNLTKYWAQTESCLRQTQMYGDIGRREHQTCNQDEVAIDTSL